VHVSLFVFLFLFSVFNIQRYHVHTFKVSDLCAEFLPSCPVHRQWLDSEMVFSLLTGSTAEVIRLNSFVNSFFFGLAIETQCFCFIHKTEVSSASCGLSWLKGEQPGTRTLAATMLRLLLIRIHCRNQAETNSVSNTIADRDADSQKALFFELCCARHYNCGSHWAMRVLSLLDNGIKRKGQEQ